MIIALDHIGISASDLEAAVAAMERVLARKAAHVDLASDKHAVFRLDNMALELAAGAAGGLGAIAFEVRDAAGAFREAERRALKPSSPIIRSNGATAVRLADSATCGVAIELIQHAGVRPSAPSLPTAAGAVTGLDHVVIRTTHPNRAAALYGARLGLDMRLDRTEPKWGSRLMFFRCGDLIVEIVHNLKDEPSDAPDRLWGLSWRVADAELARARLKANGVDVSDVRPGRKPGTRVFTLRDGTLSVPTLMVEPSAPIG